MSHRPSSTSSSNPNSSSSQSDWNNLLRHSSSIGIAKSDIVYNVYNNTPSGTMQASSLNSSTTPSSSSNPNMSSEQQGKLPSHNPRLIRTGHDANGLSVFVADQVVEPYRPFGPQGSGFFKFDLRPSVPVDNNEILDLSTISDKIPRTPPGGVNFGVTEIAPHFSVPMHRTLSIDYAVVLSGEIICELDSGEEKAIGAGEFVIQQGTNHRWHNRRQEPCRILFVMVSAEKIVLGDGSVLDETVIPVKQN